MKKHTVLSSDGLRLAAFEEGEPEHPAILFIHGFNQCSLCWDLQFASSDLVTNFRLVAFDLRGHGHSEKPLEPERYAHDRLFADDVQAVIKALDLRRPVLVGWSYAGRIISDYIDAYGWAGLSGINYVGARTNNDPRFNGPGTQYLSDMAGDDLVRNVAATRKFLDACFASPPPQDVYETMLGYTDQVSGNPAVCLTLQRSMR